MGRALTGVALTSKGELIDVNAVTSRSLANGTVRGITSTEPYEHPNRATHPVKSHKTGIFVTCFSRHSVLAL